MADRYVSVLITLSDLERRDANGEIFWRISLITLVNGGCEGSNFSRGSPLITLVYGLT